MKYIEIFEGRDAPLYHSYRDIAFAILAIKNNEIAATSTQRFWKDGRRLKDDNTDYYSSFWMKGVSTTRDIEI